MFVTHDQGLAAAAAWSFLMPAQRNDLATTGPRIRRARPAQSTGPWIAAVLLVLGLASSPPGLPDAWAAEAASAHFVSVPGIPRDVVASVEQDHEGFLWLGTGDGLARYDGYRLQMMEREGPDALARNMGWVRAMDSGADGRLWIGTEMSGLAVHDPNTRRIEVLGGPGTEPHPSVVALADDGNGRVWMGTLGGGLLRYDIAAHRFERIALPGLSAGEGQVFALAMGADGALWAGHWRGLSRWDPTLGTWTVVAAGDTAMGPVLALHPDAQGRLWIGTQRGQVMVVQPGRAPRLVAEANRSAVQSLATDDAGRLWVGHRNGLDLVDADTGRLLEQVRHRSDDPFGLAGDDITRVLRDRTGTMWVAGFGVGLQRHSSNPAIAVRGPDPDPESPLHQADVRALLALRDGRVLAATHAGRLVLLDDELRSVGTLPDMAAPVEAMAQDAEDRVWLAARGQVAVRDLEGSTTQSWSHDAGTAMWLQVDPDGTTWLGAERGLLRRRPGEAGFTDIPDEAGRSLDREVFALAPDGQGGLWVGGRAGLHHLAAGGDRLTPAVEAPGEGLGFPLVIGLLHDRRGTLWVDTPVAGLHRLIGRDAQGRLRFERISVKHAMVGRPFGANLHDDKDGRIWSQSFVYDPGNDRLDALRPADGALIGTPWFRSHTALADGRLLFGGSKGLMRIDPARFAVSREQPPLVITALRIDGLPHRPRSMVEGLVLPPGARSFGIEFAALDYGDPQLLQYRYRLAGYDPAWLPGDAGFRSPSYSELPPGEYIFEMQATNRFGVWSTATLRLPVVVQPHWWQREWVFWALVAVGVGLVWAWVSWRTRSLRRRQLQLEATVTERTAALREMSLTDPLTGLRNRRYLVERIDGVLNLTPGQADGRADKADAEFVVILVDLDHFKAINDRFGHAAGDATLVHAAATLRQVFRETDTLVRWGGEEFLVIARITDRRQAGALAERLRRELESAVVPPPSGTGPDIRLTASLGWVAYPPDPERPRAWGWDTVIQLADAALYAVKANGRNGWVGVVEAPAAVGARGTAVDWLAHQDTTTERSG